MGDASTVSVHLVGIAGVGVTITWLLTGSGTNAMGGLVQLSQREMDRLVRRANMEAHGGNSVVAEVLVCMLLWVVALAWFVVRRLI